MKKYNFYLWLTVLVGLLASCSQDEAAGPQTNTGSNRVSLTASLPRDFAQPETRALPSLANHQLRCILEVWTQDASPQLIKRIEKSPLTGDNVTFDFTLDDQGTYDCLFWADFIATDAAKNENATIGSVTYTHYADKYYKTDDATNGLKAVKLIEANYAAGLNTDVRDAFFGHYKLQKGPAAIENQAIPALTRPFAKLTIKEKDATSYGYCTGLTAQYDVPNTFNVLDGTVGSTTYSVTCSSKSSETQTLFSDYIFTTESSTFGSIKLTFTGSKDLQDITIPDGIPLKRNFKTNASGRLISEQPAPTNGVELTVTMNTEWNSLNEEHNISYLWYTRDKNATVFTLSTTDELREFAKLVNGDEEAKAATGETDGVTFEGKTVRIADGVTELDLNNEEWTPIGGSDNISFNGTFDGRGVVIKNMKVTQGIHDSEYSSSTLGGFFGYTFTSATIKNLIVEGSIDITANTSISAGGICGYGTQTGGTIEFCRFSGSISITSQMNSYPNNYAGGIAARGTLIDCCISDAAVSQTINPGESSTYTGAGGLLGCSANGASTSVTNSAWNSSKTVDVVGKIFTSPITTDTQSFTSVAELNALLQAINSSKPASEFMWQAGANGGSPVLVKRTAN